MKRIKYFLTCLGACIVLVTLFFNTKAQMMFREEPKPGVTGWVDDSHYLFRNYDAEKKPFFQKINIRTGKSEGYVPEKSNREKMEAAFPKGVSMGRNDLISSDGEKAILFMSNDLYRFSIGDTALLRLTRDTLPEMNARFSPDNQKIAYTKEKDLYIFNLATGKEIRVTFDATDKVYNGWSSWVYMEEILGRSSNYAAFWWSPDGMKLAWFRFDDQPVPLFTLNRLDEADGIHGKLEVTPYPKPGDPNPKVRIKVYNLADHKTVTVKTNPEEDVYYGWPFWTPDSRKIAIQALNRDQNDMRFLLADAVSGDFSEIYRETSPTWVDFFEDVYVLKNGTGFILKSYRSGWENLWHYGWDGLLKRQLTDVPWRINAIERVDEEAGMVYFTGTGPESTDRHFFRVGLDGDNLLQITRGEGTHQVLPSPKGSYFIDTRNSISSVGDIVAISKKGELIREVHKFDQPVYDPMQHPKTELVKIPTSDGLFLMPATLTYPTGFDASKKYPVVFTIYGGPNAGNVFNSWKGTTPSWYAKNGIITISVDHRGSGKFGKKGLDYLHRNLGKWEVSDYADAVKWLREKPFVDPSRMGITGSSYGGYMTCMALTKGADYWTHGVAGSSVTDWRLYDNVYTERYMDRPADNPEGYKAGSVLTYVKDFKGKLLLTHGDMDDNVHMQNSVYLISKLQDNGKSFEFMLYPNGRHGWGGAKRKHSTDETNNFWMKYFFGK